MDGTQWRAEIWQAAAEGAQQGTEAVGELKFDADSPLVIEWESMGKEEVIQGSSATLKIISPGDRTYVDLYTVKPCAVRLDVWRMEAGTESWQLYWRGTLDTEFYEEPYERLSGYTVTLTFTDFGVLERLKLYGHEVQTIGAILRRAMDAAGLEDTEISAFTYVLRILKMQL